MIILIPDTPEPTGEHEHFKCVIGVALWLHQPPPITLHPQILQKHSALSNFLG